MDVPTDHLRLFLQRGLGVLLRVNGAVHDLEEMDDIDVNPYWLQQLILRKYNVILGDQRPDQYREEVVPSGRRHHVRRSPFSQSMQATLVALPQFGIIQVGAHEIVTFLSTRNVRYFVERTTNIDISGVSYRQEEITFQDVVPTISSLPQENVQVHNDILTGPVQPNARNVRSSARPPSRWTSQRSSDLLTGALATSQSQWSSQTPMLGIGPGQPIRFSTGAQNSPGHDEAAMNTEPLEENKD